MKYELNIRRLLSLVAVFTLLTATGCLVSEGGRHGHARHEEIIVGPPVRVHEPVVVVRPPVVVVRPPEIIVR